MFQRKLMPKNGRIADLFNVTQSQLVHIFVTPSYKTPSRIPGFSAFTSLALADTMN